MDYSLYDDNCPYWQQPEHTAYYSNSESTYQEYEQVSNYGSYETSMGEATFNEEEIAHSHNQEEVEEQWRREVGKEQWNREEVGQEFDGGEEFREELTAQDWGEEGDAEDWENGELEQGYELEAQGYEDAERDLPYREPTPPWEHSYPTLDSPFANYTHTTPSQWTYQSPPLSPLLQPEMVADHLYLMAPTFQSSTWHT